MGEIIGRVGWVLIFGGLITYVVLSEAYKIPKNEAPSSELATISAVLGGFLFPSGFTGIA